MRYGMLDSTRTWVSLVDIDTEFRHRLADSTHVWFVSLLERVAYAGFILSIPFFPLGWRVGLSISHPFI